MKKTFDPGLPARRLARNMYKWARIINTFSYWLSGNPKKIGKHYARKMGVKSGGNIVKQVLKLLGL